MILNTLCYGYNVYLSKSTRWQHCAKWGVVLECSLQVPYKGKTEFQLLVHNKELACLQNSHAKSESSAQSGIPSRDVGWPIVGGLFARDTHQE
ncbi:hypothetical protein CEXT_248681 [Caerostris extrusa]|uniref:Uncharacterized protein n=1 Tax=Caerostris extrusa TaxID=172846 RepID=A0AAV4MCB7_CAEEX|nr:hypothetical protein CEXT_248681 [Caerostris extrusa]